MSLQEILSKGRSRSNALEVINYVSHDSLKMAELMKIVLHDKQFSRAYAGWLFHFFTDFNAYLLDDWQSEMLEYLRENPSDESLARGIIRHWGDYGYPEQIEGEVYDLCIAYLRDNKRTIAVKAHAMFACKRLVYKYPELVNEFIPILQELLLKQGDSSAAIKSRGSKVLNEMKKLRN